MLVLTRKLMEKLYIGDEICVTVVRMEGGQVRLGIEAPRHIPVVRAELARRTAAGAASPEGTTIRPERARGTEMECRTGIGRREATGVRRIGSTDQDFTSPDSRNR